MASEQKQSGVTFVDVGTYEIQDIDGTIVAGDEQEMRAEWMRYVEGEVGPNSAHNELKLVEVKAVIRT